MSKIVKWNLARDFFRQFDPGDVITRGMYMDSMKGSLFSEADLDQYRCTLQRAGYLFDGEVGRNRGVYLLVKEIPQNLSQSQAIGEAYPKRNKVKHRTVALYEEYRAGESLELLTGIRRGTRSQFVKAIWAYIYANKLKNTVNPKLIDCDDRMSQAFEGRYRIHMYDILKILSRTKELTKIPQNNGKK